MTDQYETRSDDGNSSLPPKQTKRHPRDNRVAVDSSPPTGPLDATRSYGIDDSVETNVGATEKIGPYQLLRCLGGGWDGIGLGGTTNRSDSTLCRLETYGCGFNSTYGYLRKGSPSSMLLIVANAISQHFRKKSLMFSEIIMGELVRCPNRRKPFFKPSARTLIAIAIEWNTHVFSLMASLLVADR